MAFLLGFMALLGFFFQGIATELDRIGLWKRLRSYWVDGIDCSPRSTRVGWDSSQFGTAALAPVAVQELTLLGFYWLVAGGGGGGVQLADRWAPVSVAERKKNVEKYKYKKKSAGTRLC